MLFLHITTRIPGRKNDGMLSQKGGRGFPYMVWMDSTGGVLAKQGARSVPGFVKQGKAVEAYMGLKKKADGGDKTVANAMFIAELEIGKLEWQAAMTKAKSLTLTAEEQTKADKLIFNLEVNHKFMKVRKLPRSDRQAYMTNLGNEFAKALEAGKFPTEDIAGYYFTNPIFAKAVREKNAALFEKALTKLKSLAGSNPMFKRFWPKVQQQLAQLKSQ